MKIKRILYISIFLTTIFCKAIFSIILGADISSVLELRSNNIFKDDGKSYDVLHILKKYGINFVRLRLWHTPSKRCFGISNVIRLAKKIKSYNISLLLDIHYSDTWADPSHQTKPALWKGYDINRLTKAMYRYTYDVMMQFKSNNVLPAIVQPGNEIAHGILWDEGKLDGSIKSWMRFTRLLKSAIKAIRDTSPTTKIMLHIHCGGDAAASLWFFDGIKRHDVDFDIIGLSYYPWWHGTLRSLRQNITTLADRYKKPIIIVETAYPWTMGYKDDAYNIVGNKTRILPDFPPTRDGQALFLNKLVSMLVSITNIPQTGLFYWGACYISTPYRSSPWENLALFDFDYNALPALKSLKKASIIK